MVLEARFAESDEDVAACFPVMQQLRTQLVESEFVARVRNQESAGYRLVMMEDGGRVVAVAGYRIFDCLSSGKTLYVDDLVTSESKRSFGLGGQLFDWLKARAKHEKCDCLRLDSAVHRHGAHRFYLRQQMEIRSHHFMLELS